MRKRILYKIFLAGSTQLDRQRQIIKALVSEYNATSSLHNDSAPLFHVYTYENFDDVIDINTGQTAYNQFIQDEADIAVFILAGHIGDKTKTEFNVAYNSLKSSRNAPAVYVLIHNTEESSEVIYIRELLENNGDYYKKYSDDNDLEQKVYDMLSKYSARKASVRRRKRQLLSRRVFISFFVLFLVLGAWGAFVSVRNRQSEWAINNAKEALEDFKQHPNSVNSYMSLEKALEYLDKYNVEDNNIIKQEVESTLKRF